MQFNAGKYVIATEYDRGFSSRILDAGVYKLRFRLCCDKFKTCKHFGKAIRIIAEPDKTEGKDWAYHFLNNYGFGVDNIFDGAAFDTKEQAELARRLAFL